MTTTKRARDTVVAKSTAGGTRSLTEIAYQTLKRAINRCELEPGCRVSGAQLSERYGLKSAVAHVALNRLAQEKLVAPIRRQGYIIAPITLQSAGDLYDLRIMIEPIVARRAASRLDAEQLRRLERLCRMRFRFDDRRSVEALVRTDTEFHLTIARATGNLLLANLVGDLMERSERLIHLNILISNPKEEIYAIHQDVLDALAAGDGERAEHLTRSSLIETRDVVLRQLTTRSRLHSLNLLGP